MLTIKNQINNYFKLNLPYAILITGEWGIGKTYLIKNLFKECMYYYSLFGVQEIKNLKYKVYLDILKDNNKGALNLINNDKFNLVVNNIKEITKTRYNIDIENLIDIPICADTNKKIFVFDDFERLADDKHLEVIGLINEMIEHKNYNVIVISNDNHEVNSSKSDINYLSLYREKIFGKSIHLSGDSINIESIIDDMINQSDNQPIIKTQLRNCIRNHSIWNLRIIQNIINSAYYIDSKIDLYDEKTKISEYIIDFLIYCINENSKNPEFKKNLNSKSISSGYYFNMYPNEKDTVDTDIYENYTQYHNLTIKNHLTTPYTISSITKYACNGVLVIESLIKDINFINNRLEKRADPVLTIADFRRLSEKELMYNIDILLRKISTQYYSNNDLIKVFNVLDSVINMLSLHIETDYTDLILKNSINNNVLKDKIIYNMFFENNSEQHNKTLEVLKKNSITQSEIKKIEKINTALQSEKFDYVIDIFENLHDVNLEDLYIKSKFFNYICKFSNLQLERFISLVQESIYPEQPFYLNHNKSLVKSFFECRENMNDRISQYHIDTIINKLCKTFKSVSNPLAK